MLFILYGATLDVGYETRCIFKSKHFEIINKYNYVKENAKIDAENYKNPSNNAYFEKWFDDKIYVTQEQMKELDFTYELDGVCIGFNQDQIIDAVRGVKNCLLTIGASSLSFIRELKAAYGDYVTLINIFEDDFTVRQSVEKYGCFSDSEKITRIKANQQMQKLYLENTKVFDEIVLYTGENTVYDLCALEQQYDNIIKSRSEIEKRLNNSKYVALPYNGAEPYIFVSYAHLDRDKVYEKLYYLQRNSYRVWYDDGIQWGSNWSKMIKDKIKKSECLILFTSQNAVKSDYICDEIIEAWTNNKNIYIVQLDEAEFDSYFEKRLSENQKIGYEDFERKILETIPNTTKNY